MSSSGDGNSTRTKRLTLRSNAMLDVDQIERSNDQSERSQPDAVRRSESPVDSVSELPAGRRATPSIAPTTAKRPDTTATTTDRRSSSQHSQRIRWTLFALLPIAAV